MTTPTASRFYIKTPGSTQWRPVNWTEQQVADVIERATIFTSSQRERIQRDWPEGTIGPVEYKFAAVGW